MAATEVKTVADLSISRRARIFMILPGSMLLVFLLFALPPKYQFFGGQFQSIRQFQQAPLPDNQRPVSTSPDTDCTFELFRKHVFSTDPPMWGGKWEDDGKDFLGFRPSVCKFPYSHLDSLPREYISKCVFERQIAKVLILGDSNGARHFKAFNKMLANDGFRCNTTRKETPENMKMPDPNYFANGSNIPLRDIVCHTRDCAKCYSRYIVCSKEPESGVKQSIEVEYVAMEFTIDSEVTTFRPFTSNKCPRKPAPCPHSTTYQEFIFGEYLRDNYPHLILLFSNNHDIRRRSLPQYEADLAILMHLLQTYVPETTTLVWLSRPGEYPAKKPLVWQKETFSIGSRNLTTNEMIEVMNLSLYKLFRIHQNGITRRVLPFFDLFTMSKDLQERWSTDGVHMNQAWYNFVSSYIWQTLCHSTTL